MAHSNVTELIEKLPSRLEKNLKTMLSPEELVEVKLCGAGKEALVCTNKRVIIIKAGWSRGAGFGSKTFQAVWGNITGVEVKKNLTSGYFELSAGGVQNTSFVMNSQAAQRPNCIYLTRGDTKKFSEACTYIMSRLDEIKRHTSEPNATTQSEPLQSTALMETLRQLGDLRDQGLISDDEFQVKKTEILSRI